MSVWWNRGTVEGGARQLLMRQCGRRDFRFEWIINNNGRRLSVCKPSKMNGRERSLR